MPLYEIDLSFEFQHLSGLFAVQRISKILRDAVCCQDQGAVRGRSIDACRASFSVANNCSDDDVGKAQLRAGAGEPMAQPVMSDPTGLF